MCSDTLVVFLLKFLRAVTLPRDHRISRSMCKNGADIGNNIGRLYNKRNKFYCNSNKVGN